MEFAQVEARTVKLFGSSSQLENLELPDLGGECLAGTGNVVIDCGSKLVTVSDGKDKVRALCGEPSSVSFQGVIRRAPRYEYGYGFNRYDYYGPGVIDMPVEVWTYNFGSSKLLRKLRFVGDELDDIRTDGYGY